jgi:hypothetical protein
LAIANQAMGNLTAETGGTHKSKLIIMQKVQPIRIISAILEGQMITAGFGK